MLSLLSATSPALPSAPDLRLAQERSASTARAAFRAAARDDNSQAFRLASLIAAEEQPLGDAEALCARLDARIDELADSVRPRLQLAASFGGAADRNTIATAVSSTLFGAGGADDADRAFFAGNKADYYDARNSYLDQVLERRCGIPISLSLVYAETCGRLNCEMVGLNAPAHLLLGSAGDGGGDHIVVDCFDGGRILDLDAAADLVASNAGFGEDEGAELLGNLRALPMTSRQWASRVLRNLKAVHLAADDTVRLLGACERLRLLGAAEPLASSPGEQVDCALQISLALYTLKWEERRAEARKLLEGLLGGSVAAEDNDGVEVSILEFSGEGRQQLEKLLEDPWWRD